MGSAFQESPLVNSDSGARDILDLHPSGRDSGITYLMTILCLGNCVINKVNIHTQLNMTVSVVENLEDRKEKYRKKNKNFLDPNRLFKLPGCKLSPQNPIDPQRRQDSCVHLF